jgi:hypothetical protein
MHHAGLFRWSSIPDTMPTLAGTAMPDSMNSNSRLPVCSSRESEFAGPSWPNPAPAPPAFSAKALRSAPINANPAALTARADRRLPPPGRPFVFCAAKDRYAKCKSTQNNCPTGQFRQGVSRKGRRCPDVVRTQYKPRQIALNCIRKPNKTEKNVLLRFVITSHS